MLGAAGSAIDDGLHFLPAFDAPWPQRCPQGQESMLCFRLTRSDGSRLGNRLARAAVPVVLGQVQCFGEGRGKRRVGEGNRCEATLPFLPAVRRSRCIQFVARPPPHLNARLSLGSTVFVPVSRSHHAPGSRLPSFGANSTTPCGLQSLSAG